MLLRILGESDNRRRVVDFCTERVLFVGNTYFEHKSCRSTLGYLVKCMIDLLLVKKDRLRYVHDVKALRGMG